MDLKGSVALVTGGNGGLGQPDLSRFGPRGSGYGDHVRPKPV